MIEAGMAIPADRQPRNAGSGRVRAPRRLENTEDAVYLDVCGIFLSVIVCSVPGAERIFRERKDDE